MYFNVINLDNPFPVSTSMSGNFEECFWRHISDKADNRVMNALWQREKSQKAVTIKPLSQLPEESLENATLPAELLTMILGEVEDLTDIVCFVLSCRRYYEIGRPILEARFEEILTYSWAGNRLICVGDGVSINDLPKGMLTEDEMEILGEEFGPDSGDDDSQYDTGVYEQLVFVQSLHPDWSLNHRRAHFFHKHTQLCVYFMRLWNRRYNKSSPPRLYWGEVRVLEELTEVADLPLPEYGKIPEMYRSHVLRNLTTKEYIRGDAVHEARETPDMPYLGDLTLLHLLLLRITWASDPSLAIPDVGAIESHRGAWAGHRFDFSDIRTVQDDEGGAIDDWKDVSKIAIDELVAVFEPDAKVLNDDAIYNRAFWEWRRQL
ncbi:hypothetical protein FPV67DRAFT_1455191 [Lyophyllum atratum]|nr:hypothetical protein FPV67DRAFT_1455191 [Lyophyllum atratum]